MSNQQQVLSSNPLSIDSLKPIFDKFDSELRKQTWHLPPPDNMKRLEVQTPEGSIWFPTEWQDVTLDQFIRIRKTGHTANEVLAVLASNSEILARLSADSARQIIQALPFLKTPVPMDFRVPTEVQIRNRVIYLPEDLASLHTFAHVVAFQRGMEGVPDGGLDWMVPALCTLLTPLFFESTNYVFFMGVLMNRPNAIAADVRALPYWIAYPLAIRYMEVIGSAEPLTQSNADVTIKVIDPEKQRRALRQWFLELFERKAPPGWTTIRLNVTKEQAREIKRVEAIQKQNRKK